MTTEHHSHHPSDPGSPPPEGDLSNGSSPDASFHSPIQSTPNLSGLPRSGGRENGDLRPSHDAWRRDALTEMGWLIVRWLRHHPGTHTQADIARRLGPLPGTINRHVGPDAPLVRYGLIDRTPTGQITAGVDPEPDLLDRIATEMGTAGRHAALLDGLRQEYRDRGVLDDDNYWIDPDTSTRKTRATWLLDPAGSDDQ